MRLPVCLALAVLFSLAGRPVSAQDTLNFPVLGERIEYDAALNDLIDKDATAPTSQDEAELVERFRELPASARQGRPR